MKAVQDKGILAYIGDTFLLMYTLIPTTQAKRE
jgi:hypothetical protein